MELASAAEGGGSQLIGPEEGVERGAARADPLAAALRARID